MKSPFLLLLQLALFVHAVEAQVSFAPVDSLDYSTAGRLGTYSIGNTYPVDFNNDGYDDVVILKGNSIFVRLNTGVNAFGEEALVYTDELHIYSISNFADINDDTHPDVAIATEDRIKVLYATGGIYEEAHAIATQVYYGRLILVDKDKDGKVDLASSRDRSITLYNNVSNGLTQSTTLYSDTGIVHDFRIQDLNADNIPDLIVSVYAAKLKVFFGNADGTFTSIFSTDVASLVFMEVADINLDGFRDIAYLEWSNNLFTLVYDDASGTFVQQAVFPADSKPANMLNFHLVDLKNNGTPDLVYNSFFSLAIRENNGLGQFLDEKVLFENVMNPYTFSPFNLNDDGTADILLVDYNKFQAVSFNSDGTMNMKVTQGYHADFWGVAFHDIDDDGFRDIFSVSRTGSVYIRWGNADHDYSSYSRYDIPFDAYYGAVTDINDDGYKDLLITQESSTNSVNTILVLEGKGNRQFEEPRNWKYFPDPGPPLIGDIDLDGVTDVLSWARFSNKIGWLDIQNTDYNEYFFSGRTFTIAGDGIRSLANSDLNNDGYPDLVTANALTKNVSILLNNTTGNFNETVLTPEGTPAEVTGVQAFDYNGDAYDDLLVIVGHGPNENSVQVYLNDQLGNFSYDRTHALTDMYLPERIDAMDIDGDQDVDFVVSTWDYLVTNVFIRENGMFTNKGSEIIQNCGQSARIYEDLNDDGKPDVFTANFSTGGTFIQLNNSVLPPAQPETEIFIEEINTNSVRISLGATTAGGRLVAITRGAELAASPADNFFYAANSVFGVGSSLATNAHIVHAGSSASLEITGLSSSTEYLITVFEYNVNYPQVTIINYSDEKIEKSFMTRNTPPQVASIPDQTGSNLQAVTLPLTITDVDNRMDEFTYAVTSSNHTVLPPDNISVITTGPQPVLELTPIDYGESHIELTVIDTASNRAVVSFHYTSVVVGIEDASATTRFTAYPNPFRTQINITHAATHRILMVYNSRGQLIRKFEYIPDAVDLSEEPAGLYFFKTSNGVLYKAIKE